MFIYFSHHHSTFNLLTDHDALMAHFSVKDQYCNKDTGNWHETVYPLSEECQSSSTKWWWWDKTTELTFTTDSCVGGLKLKKCSLGPCDSNEHIIYSSETASRIKSDTKETGSRSKHNNVRSKEFPFGNIVRVPTLDMK